LRSLLELEDWEELRLRPSEMKELELLDELLEIELELQSGPNRCFHSARLFHI
jgi:hypothetical protein